MPRFQLRFRHDQGQARVRRYLGRHAGQVDERLPIVRVFELVLSENDVDGSVVWMKRDDRLELPRCLFLETLAPVNNPQLSLGHPERRIKRERSLQRCNRLLGLADQSECNSLPRGPLWAPWSALFDEPKLIERVIVALLLKKLHSTLIGSVNLFMRCGLRLRSRVVGSLGGSRDQCNQREPNRQACKACKVIHKAALIRQLVQIAHLAYQCDVRRT